MAPGSCGGETSTSAGGRPRVGFAAPGHSVRHDDDLRYRVRRAPHLSRVAVADDVFQPLVSASSYFEGQEVLMVLALRTHPSLVSSKTPSA